MTKLHLPLLAAAATCSALAGQAFTSPANLLTTEGSGVHDYILFRYDDLRWQQLDDTSIGQQPTLVQRIAWRRDGAAAADPTWAPRTVDIEAVLSNSVPAGAISEAYDANYSGPPTVVFNRRPVNLPDWTQTPATSPAPFDLVLQLDTPWPYIGTESFLWELRITNNLSASDFGNDFHSASGSTGSSNSGTTIGTGCVATGSSAAVSLTCTVKNQFSRFRIAYGLTNAPPSVPAFANIDFVNSNLSIPGLCTNLIAAPTIPVPLGTTDQTGAISGYSLENIPFNPALVGAVFYSQATVLDIGQPVIPVALSNGRSNTFPATPSAAAPVTRVYGYRLPAGTMRAPSVWTGGIVARFD